MKQTTILILLLALGAAPAHSQNLLINGSFEDVDASASPYYIRSFASTPGWTQILDGVDLIHNTYTQTPTILLSASHGVQFLDMNQGASLGGIEQVVAATPGMAYHLRLDGGAWAENAIGGTLGYKLFDPLTSDILASGSLTDADGGGLWLTRDLEAVATSAQIGVRIEGLVATQAGMGLDNVQLTAVPEPTAISLGVLTAGVWLFSSAVRRNKK